MQLKVIKTRTDFNPPVFVVNVDGAVITQNYHLSRILTGTDWETKDGIFTFETHKVYFRLGWVEVLVNFGEGWVISEYDNPAMEIKRRVGLVRNAFEAVRVDKVEIWEVEINA